MLGAIQKTAFMSEVQFSLTVLVLIIILNIIITVLYRKYDRLRIRGGDTINLSNYSSTTSIGPGSFMPRLPFLILRKDKERTLRKIVLMHNLLCILVYGLFVLVIFYSPT